MKYRLDNNNRPMYLQLYEQLREDIINGNFRYHTKLPSKRSLAEETGVSIITIEHAYALLCDEGYVESKERSGFIVIFRKTDGFAVSAPLHTKEPVHHDAHAYPDFPVSVFSKTVRKVLSEYNDVLLDKSPNFGCIELREAIRHYLTRNRGLTVSVEQIVIGAGSEYLYRLIIDLLGRDLIYAIESPSYNKIEQVYQTTGIAYDSLPLTKEGIDSNALSDTKANVLHTTPYRSYPSGVTATASKRHEYIHWSKQGHRYIIEDDFESEFSISTKPTETLFAISNRDNVIYLNTFSKTISSSLRVGYMVLPLHLVEQFHQRLGFYSCTVPTFTQYVLTELISNGNFERHINSVRRKKRKEISADVS